MVTRASAIQAKVVAWPKIQNEIVTKLQDAAGKVKAADFLGADARLDSAERDLEDVRGSGVEATDSWASLLRQIQETRQKIYPQVDRLRRKEEAEQARRDEEYKRRMAAEGHRQLMVQCSVSHTTGAGKTGCEGWLWCAMTVLPMRTPFISTAKGAS